MFRVIHVRSGEPVTYISKYAICLTNEALGDRDLIVTSSRMLKNIIEKQVMRFGVSEKTPTTVQNIMNELTVVRL